jgi:hypothetical protein
MVDIHCVITRYNEHLNWINYLPDEIEKIQVVDKGYNTNNIFNNVECKYNHKLMGYRMLINNYTNKSKQDIWNKNNKNYTIRVKQYRTLFYLCKNKQL